MRLVTVGNERAKMVLNSLLIGAAVGMTVAVLAVLVAGRIK